MIANSYPSKEYLNELFRYDSKTGKLYRKIRKGQRGLIGKEVGYICSSGYRKVVVDKKNYCVHRLIWIMFNGNIPVYLQIDHINGIKDDNRLKNLRLVTNQENKRNIFLPSNNSSGVIGVYWRKDNLKWRAIIRVDQKNIHLGNFINKEDAMKARKNAEKKYGFSSRHGDIK